MDLRLVQELEGFLKEFPSLAQSYIPVDRIGEGTFSTVYKAIDCKYYAMNNSNWAHYENYLFEDEDENHWFLNEEDSSRSLIVKLALEYKKSIGEKAIHYVALKKLHRTSSPDRIIDELQFLQLLQGKFNIVPLVTAFRIEDQADYLLAMNIQQIQQYMKSLLQAVSYMHSHNIIHRDLKPSNFLYSVKQGRGLLVDYGLAQFDASNSVKNASKPPAVLESGSMKENQNPEANKTNLVNLTIQRSNRMPFAQVNQNSSSIATSIVSKPTLKIPLTQQYTFFSPQVSKTLRNVQPTGFLQNDSRPPLKAPRAGTRGFRAPEVLFKSTNQSISIDIWSVGVIFLTLLTKQYPFFNSNDDLEALVELSFVFGYNEMRKIARFYNRKLKMNIPGCPNESPTFQKIIQNFNKTNFMEIPKEAFDLLEKLLCLDSHDRITAEAALIHPFFSLSL